jgi:hypothetical protein
MTVHQHIVQLRGKPAFTVNAIQPHPGLFVYCDLAYSRCGEVFQWHVSHHEGLLIASAPSALVALEVVEEIAELADWTRPAKDIAADPAVDAAEVRERILYRTDAVFHTNRRSEQLTAA